jgi:hypothetical protein
MARWSQGSSPHSAVTEDNHSVSAWIGVAGRHGKPNVYGKRAQHMALVHLLMLAKGDSYRLRGKDLDARIGAKPAEIG